MVKIVALQVWRPTLFFLENLLNLNQVFLSFTFFTSLNLRLDDIFSARPLFLLPPLYTWRPLYVRIGADSNIKIINDIPTKNASRIKYVAKSCFYLEKVKLSSLLKKAWFWWSYHQSSLSFNSSSSSSSLSSLLQRSLSQVWHSPGVRVWLARQQETHSYSFGYFCSVIWDLGETVA